jgi:hypothetical protein
MGPWTRQLLCCSSNCVFKINDQRVSMYAYRASKSVGFGRRREEPAL